MHSPLQSDSAIKLSIADISIQKARQTAEALKKGLPFVRLASAERDQETGIEAVVIEVEVELGQRIKTPIMRFERLAVLFDPNDELSPEVIALREDFPETSHQNRVPTGSPRSLCLYEEPYCDRKLRWTPVGLIERAREWLRLTARGELHQEDQPLEPLLGPTLFTVILPHNFLELAQAEDLLPGCATRIGDEQQQTTYVVIKSPRGQNDAKQSPNFAIALFKTSEVQHGTIANQPTNLLELDEFCKRAGLDLLQGLQARIKRYWQKKERVDALIKTKLIIGIVFPKVRETSKKVESYETWLFLTRCTVEELSAQLGVVQKNGGHLGYIIGEQEFQTKGMDRIIVAGMRPTWMLDRAGAANLSNTTPKDMKVIAIGMGAIGSYIFDNMTKCGFGSWTIVDNDTLLPHNCIRHVLAATCVGMPKADLMRCWANENVADIPIKSIVANVLSPDGKKAELENCIMESDVILGMSASIAVSRYLALECNTKARRASVFMNPSGSDLIILIEDRQRAVPLDWLEMLYYQIVATKSGFENHYKAIRNVRYSRSCGDISGRISGELVELHAATASRLLRESLLKDGATATVFRCEDDFSTTRHHIEIVVPISETVDGWRVMTTPQVFEKASELRRERVPNETGGILLGWCDTNHRIIYITGLLSSPSDSQEWPDLYIRGCKGLREAVETIAKRSHNSITYIGEWHSHPDGTGTGMSQKDRVALVKVAKQMELTGCPGIMLISGANNHYSLNISASNRQGV